MRILILSDTHGNYPLALSAMDNAGDVAEIVHLGDETEDAEMLETITGRTVIRVSGNCDRLSSAPRETLLYRGGKSIFITHGDRYLVKSGLYRLHEKALVERAQIVLYGHTHRASVDVVDGILYVNPGTLSRGSTTQTFAILTIEGSESSAAIIGVQDACQHPQPQL